MGRGRKLKYPWDELKAPKDMLEFEIATLGVPEMTLRVSAFLYGKRHGFKIASYVKEGKLHIWRVD